MQFIITKYGGSYFRFNAFQFKDETLKDNVHFFYLWAFQNIWLPPTGTTILEFDEQ